MNCQLYLQILLLHSFLPCTYILSRGAFTYQESPNAGGSVGLSKGRLDSSKSSIDGMAPCRPCCLVLSRTGYRNVSQPWNALTVNWLNMHIMTIQQELKA